jgi:CIC family chloride channel protein
VVSHHFFGDIPAFVVPAYSLVSAWELAIYAGLGLAAGLTALLFSKVLYAGEDFFDGPLKWIPGPVRATLGGFLIGVIALRFPEIMGVGYEAIEMALNEQMVWHALLVLALVKIAAVSITIGSGGSGGVFAPSLMIGAMLGGAIGWAAHSVWPDATASSGAYALVGAGAVVAAATHAPLTAFMIIFELTNDYKIIMPLMIACVIATLLATRLSEASIYTRKLLRRGMDVFGGRTLNVLNRSQVRDHLRAAGHVVAPEVHLADLAAHFLGDPHESLYVVDGEGRYLGVVTYEDLKPFLAAPQNLDRAVIALDIMRMGGIPTVGPETRLDQVMRRFGSWRHDIPVVEDGRLLGVVQRQDVIDHYNAEIFKAEMASSMAGSLDDTASSPIPGVANMALAEVPAPASFIGRTCSDLDLRNRFGVTLVLVKQRVQGGHEIVNQVPDADFKFEDGDVLLAVGAPDRLKALQNLL